MRVKPKGAEFKELVSKVLTFDYLGALAVFPASSRSSSHPNSAWRVSAPFVPASSTPPLPYPDRARIQSRATPLLPRHPPARADCLVRPRRRLRLRRRPHLIQNRTKLFRRSRSSIKAIRPYQRLVVTRWKDDTRLYINGDLQFSSRDEARYRP